MLTRTKPMKPGNGLRRTGFKSRQPVAWGEDIEHTAFIEQVPVVDGREARLQARAAAAMASAQATAEHKSTIKPRAMAVGNKALQGIVLAPAKLEALQKSNLVRSKPYLRMVASQPCAHCGRHGPSQAAHKNEGKGFAMKASDLDTFPMCADGPGRKGCHAMYDQYELFSREQAREFAINAIANTQMHIAVHMGWPESVPMPAELALMQVSITRQREHLGLN